MHMPAVKSKADPAMSVANQANSYPTPVYNIANIMAR